MKRKRWSEAKRCEERDVFRCFASVARLDLAPRSVRSLNPPKPDISCRIHGVPTYFEVTRMGHRGSADSMGRHLSALTRGRSPEPLRFDTYDDRIALREALSRKSIKGYPSAGRPVCLLVWIDGVFHPPGMPSSWARSILNELGAAGPWNAMWLFDKPRNRVVASWSREGGAG